MMYTRILIACLLASCTAVFAQKPTPRLTTRWTQHVTPENAWQQYPRPQQVRKEWLNLNGMWELDTAIGTKAVSFGQTLPARILVPFAVESYLSGIMKRFEHLLYRRTFTVPDTWKGKRVLLHFEAVDWHSVVYVNGKQVGEHKGGYDPFSFDITPYLTSSGAQELEVKVFDPTNDQVQPVGKQVKKPGGIFYTSTTGIWQTVWLEPVGNAYVESFKMVPDIDAKQLVVTPTCVGATTGSTVTVTVLDGTKAVATASGKAGTEIRVKIPAPKLWSPASPFLYNLTVSVQEGKNVTDRFDSYCAMRKVSLGKNSGQTKIMLNNEFVFQMGVLDQGYWPDGLCTAPNEEAYIWDIQTMKDMGFNLLRKHAKTESRRWYYLCDKMGMLVWQDMPQASPFGFEKRQTAESNRQFEAEWKNIMNAYYNYPSIIMWVVFNEAWGQYDTERLTAWTKQHDPSRLVSNASGWTDHNVGDIVDWHVYPGPDAPIPEEKRAAVLGEFGGLGLFLEAHTWQKGSWGYVNMSNPDDLKKKYSTLIDNVWKLANTKGTSAVVYTQLSDVEGEVNGLISYDREVIKIPVKEVAQMQSTSHMWPITINYLDSLFLTKTTVELFSRKGEPIHYTLDGTVPTAASPKYTGPLTLTQSATLQAKILQNGKENFLLKEVFTKADNPKPAVKPLSATLPKGVHYSLYKGHWDKLPDFTALTPVKQEYVSTFSPKEVTSEIRDFGLVMEALIRIEKPGVYTFSINSDDGSRMYIDNTMVADNDGGHGMVEKKGQIALQAGYHSIKILYFQGVGDLGLEVYTREEGSRQKKLIPASLLFRAE